MSPLPKFLINFGTLPFILLALAATTGLPLIPAERADIIFLTYAALILSFIGGLNWGFLLSNPAHHSKKYLFVWSTALMLLSWGALFLHKTPYAYLLLTLLYIKEILAERAHSAIYPEGYLAPRKLPMAISALTLLAVFAFKLFS